MQQYATKLNSKTAAGSAARKQIGLDAPGLDPTPTIATGTPAAPPPLSDATVGYSLDDPRRKAMRAAGAAETILGQKLG